MSIEKILYNVSIRSYILQQNKSLLLTKVDNIYKVTNS